MTMTKEYKYTVCTCCFTYNQDSYITDTLNGFCIQQTSFPVVYCILDDASTDDEQNVLRQWSKENLCITEAGGFYWKKTEYGEIIFAPLKGNDKAHFVIVLFKENHHQKNDKLDFIVEWWQNAEYFALCEGDDYWIASDKLQKQADFLDVNPMYGMVRTNVDRLYQDNGFIEKRYFDKSRIKDTYPDYIYHAWWAAPCTWLLRTEMYKDAYVEAMKIHYAGGFGGDISLVLYFSSHSLIKYMSEVTAVYRILNSSMSHFDNNQNKSGQFFERIQNTQRYYASERSAGTRLCLELLFLYKSLRYKLGVIKRSLLKKTK